MIEKEELLTLIPHRGKMMMLDRINKFDLQEKSIEAQYCITEDCLFYNEKEEGVPSWVGLEFIAQAIAAFNGIRERESRKPPNEPPTATSSATKSQLPAVGYILGISQLNIGLSFIKKNSIITINSRELEEMHPVYVFNGELILNGQEVLSGKITVMEVLDGQK